MALAGGADVCVARGSDACVCVALAGSDDVYVCGVLAGGADVFAALGGGA